MTGADSIPRAVDWHRARVRLVDQRQLPDRLVRRSYGDVDALVEAIRTMVVRGAPSLGATGAYGVALAVRTATGVRGVRAAARRIAGARPTAVNLAWGVGRAHEVYESGGDFDAVLATAESIADAEAFRNRQIGAHGAGLLARGARIVTHCNTGGLAAVEYGTALGVVRAAHERGLAPSVLVDETRPRLQGARLTAWELAQLEIPAALIADGAAASFMAAGEVDAVIVGADRIAANGDVANKIGTYSLAVLARHHDVPFYVAAPTTTVDLDTGTGSAIVIEERDSAELTEIGGTRIAPPGFAARNPAFDVTPGVLISGIVTEVGVARRPYQRSLAAQSRSAADDTAGHPSVS